MKILFGYSDSDDRMWLRAGSEGPLWWLTRRLALRLVSEWAGLMERTLPEGEGQPMATEAGDGAGPVPARVGPGLESADAAPEDSYARVLAEHRAAMERPRAAPAAEQGVGAAAGAAEAPVPAGVSALVYSVDLGSAGGRIRLVLRSAGEQQAIVVPRDDSHRLLAGFVSRCRRNGWLDVQLPAWLAERPASGRVPK